MLPLILVILPSIIVWATGTTQSHDEVSRVEPAKVGIVLGTSAKVSGQDNLFFKYRMEAAAELYKSGKVECLLLSGANPSEYYNEPLAMMQALIAKGVPKDKMALDFAGLRTLDSVYRAQKIFGVDDAIFVSQAFHNHRAMFIANHIGMQATGYNAKDVPSSYGTRTHIREILARVKMLLDLHILNTQPRHMGEKVALPSK